MPWITFSDGTRMDVQSTVKQIEAEIGGVTTPNIPLINVVDSGGRELRINANHIRDFRQFESSERQVHLT
jgi:hypothetical protein